MVSDNNKILNKKNFHDKFSCALCGRVFENNKSIQEIIDGDRYLFDSQNCIAIFKKLANLYGREFRSISAGEQYVYDSHLRSYVLREQEWSTIKKEIGTIENQTFQIIRDPLDVQELAFKLAWSSENEILGLFSTSNAFHRQERMGIFPKLQQLEKNNDKLRIRILTPFDDHIDLVSKTLKDEYDIDIMNHDES